MKKCEVLSALDRINEYSDYEVAMNADFMERRSHDYVY